MQRVFFCGVRCVAYDGTVVFRQYGFSGFKDRRCLFCRPFYRKIFRVVYFLIHKREGNHLVHIAYIVKS